MIGEIWKYDRKDLEIWSERFGIWMERFGNMIWEIQYNLNTSIDISDGKIQITTPTQRACLDSTKQCEPTEPRFYPGEFVTLLVATSVHVLAQEFSLFGCTPGVVRLLLEASGLGNLTTLGVQVQCFYSCTPRQHQYLYIRSWDEDHVYPPLASKSSVF